MRGDGLDRFLRVRQEAARLVPTGDEESYAPPYPARLYGGFSFAAGRVKTRTWEAFPTARFILPEVELYGEEGGGRLVVQALHGGADDPPVQESALTERLEELVQELAETRSPTPGSDPAGAETVRRQIASPSVDGREPWEETVRKVLEEIDRGRVSKVVLARHLDVPARSGMDPLSVLMRLHRTDNRAHVFLFEPETREALVGAAPETVATLIGRRFHATAVAGSAPEGQSPEESREMAERLLVSEKDLREHALTVQEMVRSLEPILDELAAEEHPHVLHLPGIQHLETRLAGRAPADSHVLRLLAALHPTPAVCGLPRAEALSLIGEEEPFDRGWYAGPVGWFDLEGNGVFAPALRSGVRAGDRWRLFAGAGVVAGSRPELEWEETGMKFEPVLRALAPGGDR